MPKSQSSAWRWLTNEREWGIGLIILLAGLLLAYFLTTALRLTGGVLSVPLDDAWIHYQFARNLSQGDGFSYVPGVPTAGSTAPLWTLLLAGIGLITHDFVPSSLLLSAGLFLLTIWLTYRLTLDFTGNRPTALLAATGVAVTGRLLWAGLSAMEVTLFTALSVGAVWAYQWRGLGALTAALFALASQTRPEGHVLFALAVLDAVLTMRRSDPTGRPSSTWSGIVSAILIYGTIQLPYTLFSLSTTGHPLPNTFYAKARQPDWYSWRTLFETLQYHWRDNLLALILLPFGLWAFWRRNRLVGGWLIGLFLVLPLVVPFLWHHGRYTMPLIPFQMILASAGLYWLVGKLRERQDVIWPAIAGLLLAAGLWQVPYWAGMLSYNTREILDIDVAMGKWLAANIPADELVAIDDIGAIVFFGPRPIVDLHGLVSPEMWPVLDDIDPSAAALRLLATHKVRYLAVFPGSHPALVSDSTIARPVQRFTTPTHSIILAPEAVVYVMDWPYRQSITPQNEQMVTFGGAIRLRGYDWQPDEPALNLTLYWESVTVVTNNYKTFIHILDENDAIVAQADRQPVNGLAPTSRWQPGDLIRDSYRITLPSDLPPGPYAVRVGLYTEENGRLPITGGPADDAINLLDWQKQPVD
jgi:hypothetical protein